MSIQNLFLLFEKNFNYTAKKCNLLVYLLKRHDLYRNSAYDMQETEVQRVIVEIIAIIFLRVCGTYKFIHLQK